MKVGASIVVLAGVNPAGGAVSGEYNALASGATFGTQTVNAATNGTFVNVTLDSAALAFLNTNAAAPFAFGGYLAGISSSD